MPTLEQSRQRAKNERLQAHKIDDHMYRVYNVVKNTHYDVLKSRSGIWTCTCPFAVKSSHIKPGVCKHLARVLDKENGCQGCQAKNRRLVDGKCPSCRFEDKMLA
jgi:hypothetical protein